MVAVKNDAEEMLKQLTKNLEYLVERRKATFTDEANTWLLTFETFSSKYLTNTFYEEKIKKIFQESLILENGVGNSIKFILNQCKSELQEQVKEAKNATSSLRIKTSYSYSKVFIVHGHNGELKQSVARLIEKQGIEAIILDEQANQGRTIIEKFEGNSDVGGAICLFTADDLGRKNGEEEKARARQNVVFEAGYFMGKLGRDHVVIIAEPEIELPSDLSGIVYSNKDKWKIDVLKELKAMGYSIDMNKLFE